MAFETYEDARSLVASISDQSFDLPEYAGSTTDLAYLKTYVIDLVTEIYAVPAEVFASATIFSTSILRDFVNRAVFNHAEIPAFSSLEALGETIAPLGEDVAPLLRYPATESCGGTAWQFYQVCRAFDFETVHYSAVDDLIGQPYEGHVTTLVFLEDLDKWIAQDAYCNYLFTDTAGNILSFYEARAIAAQDQNGIVLDGFEDFLRFRELGQPLARLHPDDEAIIRDSLFRTPYSWAVSDEQGVYSSGMELLFSDPATAHSALQGGTFTSANAALTFIDDLRAQGHTWQSAVTALRDDHYAAGFKLLVDQPAGELDWITVQLADGTYISVRFDTGGFVYGSLDQLALEANEVGPQINGDVSVFLSPFAIFNNFGYIEGDWISHRLLLDGNSEPLITLLERTAQAGEERSVLDFFSAFDADGDAATNYVLYDTDASAGSSSFRSIDGETIDAAGRIISAADIDKWHVLIGSNPGSGGLQVWMTDGLVWTGAALEISLLQTLYDVGGDQVWSDMVYRYTPDGLNDAVLFNYDSGGSLQVTFDVLSAHWWSDWQIRSGPGGQVEADLFTYDSGGRIRTDYDISGGDIWSQAVFRYNAAGQLEATLHTFDAGGSLRVDYDAVNSFIWSESHNRYNDGGQLVAQRFKYDAGGRLDSAYDVDDAFVWDAALSRYDDLGRLEAQRFNYDGGGWLSVLLDPDNAKTWASHQSRYNSGSAIEADLYIYDDNSQTMTVFDALGAEQWQYYVDTYSPTGVLLTHRFMMDDGTIV